MPGGQVLMGDRPTERANAMGWFYSGVRPFSLQPAACRTACSTADVPRRLYSAPPSRPSSPVSLPSTPLYVVPSFSSHAACTAANAGCSKHGAPPSIFSWARPPAPSSSPSSSCRKHIIDHYLTTSSRRNGARNSCRTCSIRLPAWVYLGISISAVSYVHPLLAPYTSTAEMG